MWYRCSIVPKDGNISYERTTIVRTVANFDSSIFILLLFNSISIYFLLLLFFLRFRGFNNMV